MPRSSQRSKSRRKPAPSRTRASTIHWNRIGRVALLGVLGVILLLYVSPTKHWIAQSRTAGHQQAEIDDLQNEHERLKARLGRLQGPGALEEQARRLGMVKAGERAFVIESFGR